MKTSNLESRQPVTCKSYVAPHQRIANISNDVAMLWRAFMRKADRLVPAPSVIISQAPGLRALPCRRVAGHHFYSTCHPSTERSEIDRCLQGRWLWKLAYALQL